MRRPGDSRGNRRHRRDHRPARHLLDPGHIVACTDGEIRQEYEVILTGRPVSGTPAANDEASAAAWFTVDELDGLDIHPTQWRQLRDWINDSHPQID